MLCVFLCCFDHINDIQVSFRQLLTMLAVFDCVFITTVSVSFSLPQLSSYWKVIIMMIIVVIITIMITIFVTLSSYWKVAILPLLSCAQWS